jgi:diguanylate cyclase (GGDEF)-like protein
MKILLVDDVKSERMVISAYLQKMGHEVIVAEHGKQAVDDFARVQPDLVLMDVIMPEMDGHEAARQIRANSSDWVPIIFLSGRTNNEDIVAGIDAGGDDYLHKPVDHTVLAAKMKAMQRIAAMRHKLLGVSRELEIANAELRHLANIDGLTGLSNRRHLDQVLRSEMSRSFRNNQPLSVILADVDHFKAYNDTYGHLEGDDCLRKVGKVIGDIVKRSSDLVARYGGEEFALILPDTPAAGANLIAQSICQAVEKLNIPHKASSVSGVCTLSVGVYTCLPQLDDKVEALFEKADACLYQSKKSGRNRVTAAFCERVAAQK